MSVITRFAPSPTGLLHLGHIASAQAAFGFALEHGGTCLLRIEDIDRVRCKPEYERAIYEDLDWLGFDWPLPARRQSEHFEQYGAIIQQLAQRGLVYRCFKTRKEILDDIARAPHGRPGPKQVYMGPATPLSGTQEQSLIDAHKPYAWRLSLARSREVLGPDYDALSFVNNGQRIKAQPERLGDVILGRKDVGTSYHLACTHDDALQKITDIVRGEDLLDSTHIHVLLQALMGWPTPIYHHHELLLDEGGQRLAKRDGAQSIRALRAEHLRPKDILARAQLPS